MHSLTHRPRTLARCAPARAICRAVSCGAAGVALATLPASGQASTAAPLTLRQLLDRVAARHPLVEAAHARARAAEGVRRTAGVLGNPMLSYQVENAPLPGRDAPPMEREAMTTATLPLEPLYQRGARVRRADADVRAARAEATAERQRVILDAARAYYRTALAQVAVDAARDLSGWMDTVVAYNRARVEEGVAAEADLIRSELERDRAASDATMQEADLARARAQLAAFLGDSGRTLSDLAVAVGEAPLALPSFSPPASTPSSRAPRATLSDTAGVSLLGRALEARPELQAARERLTAASAGISLERTMLVRQLGATLGTKRSAGTTSLVAGLSLPIPLFDRNRGEVARAAAEREAAAYELAAQERAVRAEVTGAYEAARLLSERAGVLARGPRGASGYLRRADEARRIALGAYREGAVPLFQVIDAARAWGEARIAFYQTLFAQHESVLELLVAQGIDLLSALPALVGDGDPRGGSGLNRGR